MKNLQRVILLDNGGFAGMESVSFPVEVIADVMPGVAIANVSTEEIYRIGATGKWRDESYPWSIGDECEVVQ